MELHSYAKHRTLKKWTMEHNRKLVDTRIAHDAWFNNKPSSLVPWRNVLTAANLTDFNVFFVKKQWSSMLARYKQYKQSRMGSNISTKAIDAELIKRINQEWEFFEPIHKFMTRKTTNLHSYALTRRSDNNNEVLQQETTSKDIVENSTVKEQELSRPINKSPTKLLLNETVTINLPKDCIKENIPNNNKIVVESNNVPQNDGNQLLSSDNGENFQVLAETTRIIKAPKKRQKSGANDKDDENKKSFVRNTDHDFYSKKSSLGYTPTNELNCREEHPSNYFADVSLQSEGSSNTAIDLLQIPKPTTASSPLKVKTSNESNNQSVDIKLEKITEINSLDVKEEMLDRDFMDDMPSTSTENNMPQAASKSRLSEREQYYRHKRRFNRRLEMRFDALLRVMGEIVKSNYPTIDITPLVSTVTTLGYSVGAVLSSESEDDELMNM